MKHIVVRYSEKFGATIDLHNKVAQENGFVWFGKMGSTIANRWIRIFDEQLSRGQNTFLFLVRRDGTRYVFHKARILQIQRDSVPATTEMPGYYADHNLIRQMSCFFKIDLLKPCLKNEIEKIRLASSGSPVTETLSGSMAGLFIVES